MDQAISSSYTYLSPLLHPAIKKFLSNKNQLFEIYNNIGGTTHIVFPNVLEENVQKFKSVFEQYKIKNKILFAAKSNKSVSFLEAAFKSNIGIEVSSFNELKTALSTGFTGNNIAVSGPIKEEKFLGLAAKCSATISIDAIEELYNLIKIVNLINAPEKLPILIRINDLATSSKFGIPIKELPNLYRILHQNGNLLTLVGFSFHLASYSYQERINAILALLEEVKKARAHNFAIQFLNIGGGFTVQYVEKNEWIDFQHSANPNLFYNNKRFESFYPYYTDIAKEKFLEKILVHNHQKKSISEKIKEANLQLIIEPGRSLLDQAGITLIQVQGCKSNASGENIIVTNANINHLSEQWFNTEFLPTPILISKEEDHRTPYTASIAGNTCLESDMLSWRKINFKQKPKKGDLLVYINTAAYQMDSNESKFLRLPLPTKIAALVTKEAYSWKLDHSVSIIDLFYEKAEDI